MNKKRFWMIPLSVALLGLTACSSEDDFESRSGKLAFACEPSDFVTEVVTRADGIDLSETYGVTVPEGNDMALTLTGTYNDKELGEGQTYNRSWTTVTAFHTEDPDLVVDGTYAATVTHGDATAEGENKPAFKGEATGITLKSNTTTTCTITAGLVNSCFTLAATEWLLNYYSDIELTIHTTTGGSDFTFNPTTTQESKLYFIRAGQTLSISGKATKQNGVEVTFEKTVIGKQEGSTTATVTTEAAKKYTITVDHSTAGGERLTITFDDTFTEVTGTTEELNKDDDDY